MDCAISCTRSQIETAFILGTLKAFCVDVDNWGET
jgi:hypothetical protein